MIAIVYLVAGMSSRFEGKIKQFVKVGKNDETLMEISLNQALKAGFSKIIFIVGEKTEKPFKEKFGTSYKGVPVEYAYQYFDKEKRNKPWGTTDALCAAKNLIDCPFVVCNGDDLYGENSFQTLFNHLESNDSCATIGYELKNVLPEKGEVNRAIFKIEKDKVKSLKEEFKISKQNYIEKGLNENSLCSMNLFGLHPNVLDNLSKILEEFKIANNGNKDIECLLPTEISNLLEKNIINMMIYKSKDDWIGVTNPGDEIILKKFLEDKSSI